jgi:hypothetical protein
VVHITLLHGHGEPSYSRNCTSVLAFAPRCMLGGESTFKIKDVPVGSRARFKQINEMSIQASETSSSNPIRPVLNAQDTVELPTLRLYRFRVER